MVTWKGIIIMLSVNKKPNFLNGQSNLAKLYATRELEKSAPRIVNAQ